MNSIKMSMTPKNTRKKAGWAVPLLLAASFACSVDIGTAPDARVGEQGLLRFSGGGGCNDSTTLALGATAHLRLEPAADQALPGDLSPRSSAPEIIAAASGESSDEIVLDGRQVGEAMIEILSGGEVYDRLGFAVAVAHSAAVTVAGEVFAGGTLAVKIDEIYGACGEDCPLIGGDFIEWSIEPAGAMELDSYQDRLALLISTVPGQVRITGREPGAGHLLVDETVEILPADLPGTLRCRTAIAVDAENTSELAWCPDSLAPGNLALVELRKVLADGREVPLAGGDVQWSIAGDQGVLRFWPETADQPLVEGPVFEALAPGQVRLEATVPITGDTLSIDLTVAD